MYSQPHITNTHAVVLNRKKNVCHISYNVQYIYIFALFTQPFFLLLHGGVDLHVFDFNR